MARIDLVVDDCLYLMAGMPDGCCDLIFCDPPYNLRKAAWDSGHDWRTWLPEVLRVLAFNGALWVIHGDPEVLLDISRAIVEQGGPPRVNWVTWDKYNGQSISGTILDRTLHTASRSYNPFAEFLVYHADDGHWQRQSDTVRGFIFEPLREYLDGELSRSGYTKQDVNEALGFRRMGGMAGRHYFSPSQWCLPTPEHYGGMQTLLNSRNGGGYLCREYEDLRSEYEDLRREYEDLRREYEDLRPTFNNPGKVSSVWPGPPAKKNGHETPKPLWLLERIVETTSNEGDLVFDPFLGSGTTAVAAQKLGRQFIGCDINAKYVAITKRRLETLQQEQRQLELSYV